MNHSLTHRYIVVEGPIGVGKTHLVKRLAESFSGSVLLEQPEQNPFLEKFYLYPKQSALPTQLSFLMQRVKLGKSLNQDDLFNDLHIADFMVPDLVIYLQASLPVLKSRIAQRGISYEQHVEEGYLKRLADTYADFFHYYDASPLLIVNAEQIDLVNGDQDYLQLLEQICSIQSGRHYYNPLPVSEKK